MTTTGYTPDPDDTDDDIGLTVDPNPLEQEG